MERKRAIKKTTSLDLILISPRRRLCARGGGLRTAKKKNQTVLEDEDDDTAHETQPADFSCWSCLIFFRSRGA